MVQIWSLEERQTLTEEALVAPGKHLTALTCPLFECSWDAVMANQRSAQLGPSEATCNKGEESQEEHGWKGSLLTDERL